MSTATELKTKNVDELENELSALYREQFNLRMQQGSGQDIKPHSFKRVRREIARIKTVIKQKTVAGA
ncbi:MAG: 50S ribosomal protein L29 [Gammaproteobacteria bacterium]|nr:50S ribosomal protein L29 [Gammaproteobacteria bacterium]